MVRFENEITIERPVEEVFDFIADLENLPRWNYYVMNVTKTSAGSSTVGSEYHQVRKQDEQDLRVVEQVPNQLLIIETIPPSKPQLKRSILFESGAHTTRILDAWELDLGLPALVEKLSAGRVRSAVEDNLKILKTLLETGQATLQDGRSQTLPA